MKPKKIKNLIHLAIFHQQQCYGGNEEGGWHYYAGELQGNYHTFDASTEEQEIAVSKLRDRVQRALNYSYDINKRALSSVLSEGVMTCEMWRGEDIPANYPKQKPHYE
jgi:hypothetical protein